MKAKTIVSICGWIIICLPVPVCVCLALPSDQYPWRSPVLGGCIGLFISCMLVAWSWSEEETKDDQR